LFLDKKREKDAIDDNLVRQRLQKRAHASGIFLLRCDKALENPARQYDDEENHGKYCISLTDAPHQKEQEGKAKEKDPILPAHLTYEKKKVKKAFGRNWSIPPADNLI